MTEQDRVLVCQTAVDLLSVSGENEEYDRAVVEMTTALLGLSSEHKEGVGMVLRAIKTGVVDEP